MPSSELPVVMAAGTFLLTDGTRAEVGTANWNFFSFEAVPTEAT